MSKPVHDPTVLRAVAHPVRSRILSELDASGSMRAADLARELDIPANQASFHLRQLAKYGLVEEDPDAARDRRDRVWKPVDDGGLTFDLTALAEVPGGRSAAEVFRRSASQWGHVVVETAYSEERPEGTVRSVTDQAIRLTREEAGQLSSEVQDLLDTWVARTRGRDPDRSTYLFFSVIAPYPAIHLPPEEG